MTECLPRITVLLAAAWVVCAGFVCASDWIETLDAGVFEVRSEFALTESDGRLLLEQMETLQTEVNEALGLKATDQPVEVNLFKNKFTYSRFLSQRIPGGCTRPALFVQGPDRGRVYVYRRWGFETDVRHESTHAVLHNALPYVPLWLDEGLAEYFEVPQKERAGDNAHLGAVKRMALIGWRPNLKSLESKRDLADMGNPEYREAWAWAHFMLHGPPPARRALRSYLHDIERGAAPGRLSDRLAESFPDPTAACIEHFRHWR